MKDVFYAGETVYVVIKDDKMYARSTDKEWMVRLAKNLNTDILSFKVEEDMPVKKFDEHPEKFVRGIFEKSGNSTVSKECSRLEMLVVHQLIEDGFNLFTDDAYSYCDQLMLGGRVHDYFQAQLDALNWNNIYSTIYKIIQGSNNVDGISEEEVTAAYVMRKLKEGYKVKFVK